MNSHSLAILQKATISYLGWEAIEESQYHARINLINNAFGEQFGLPCGQLTPDPIAQKMLAGCQLAQLELEGFLQQYFRFDQDEIAQLQQRLNNTARKVVLKRVYRLHNTHHKRWRKITLFPQSGSTAYHVGR